MSLYNLYSDNNYDTICKDGEVLSPHEVVEEIIALEQRLEANVDIVKQYQAENEQLKKQLEEAHDLSAQFKADAMNEAVNLIERQSGVHPDPFGYVAYAADQLTNGGE